jgi:hypothetical protein
VISLHIAGEGQEEHVPPATEGHPVPASHPLLTWLSSLNLLAEHVTAVHVEEDEQEVQVPPATEGHPASHPLLAWLSSSNLLTVHDEMVVQMDALDVAAAVQVVHDVAPATDGHPASQPLLA